jgi:hypothetical protein
MRNPTSRCSTMRYRAVTMRYCLKYDEFCPSARTVLRFTVQSCAALCSMAVYTRELHSVLNCVVHCTVVYCAILS